MIIDARDFELVRILKMLSQNVPISDVDNLYVKLARMISEFGEFDEVEFDKESEEQLRIIKTAGILLNREIYSNSFTQI